jgi:hypothetical protein
MLWLGSAYFKIGIAEIFVDTLILSFLLYSFIISPAAAAVSGIPFNFTR